MKFYMYFGNADTHKNRPELPFRDDSMLCVGPLLHKHFQDVLGSGQIFWNNGLTHSCTHSVSLYIPCSPSVEHTKHSRQRTFEQLRVFHVFTCHRGRSPHRRVSTLQYVRQLFNIKLLRAVVKTARKLKMHNVVTFVSYSALRPREKGFCLNSYTRAFK